MLSNGLYLVYDLLLDFTLYHIKKYIIPYDMLYCVVYFVAARFGEVPVTVHS